MTKPFTYTCPDCPRGGKGCSHYLQLRLHLLHIHGWTREQIEPELAEQRRMDKATR